jgi:hypothetical protein
MDLRGLNAFNLLLYRHIPISVSTVARASSFTEHHRLLLFKNTLTFN